MPMNFGTLTVFAGAGPRGNVVVHSRPDEALSYELNRGTNTWVGEVVQGIEDLPPKCLWDDGARIARRNVTDDSAL